jgi:hypothetical protein
VTSARNRSASARQATIALDRSGSRVGAGQSTAITTSEAAEAIPQPASRAGIDDNGPAKVIGRMNASRSDVVAPASTELTTPEKSTPKATRAIATAESQTVRPANVPRQTRTAPTPASAACARNRSRIDPEKSTSSRSAKDPNAAKVAMTGLPMTLSPMANIAGMTIAVRAARRSDAYPRSCSFTQRRRDICGSGTSCDRLTL